MPTPTPTIHPHVSSPSPPPRTPRQISGLNHWQVPQSSDYSRPYCSACHFVDCDRCKFCQTSKLSTVNRIPLPKFGAAVLNMSPNITAHDLVALMARYTVSDKDATEINRKLQYRTPNGQLCEDHAQMAESVTEFNHKLRRFEEESNNWSFNTELLTKTQADLKKLQVLIVRYLSPRLS